MVRSQLGKYQSGKWTETTLAKQERLRKGVGRVGGEKGERNKGKEVSCSDYIRPRQHERKTDKFAKFCVVGYWKVIYLIKKPLIVGGTVYIFL